MSLDVKKYSVIKWLENKQFDRNNEFTGRITSVLHSNILDIDAEYLTAGMQINVFRNGQIWRAKVIIPKSTISVVDLPPSNNRILTTVLPDINMDEFRMANDDMIENNFENQQYSTPQNHESVSLSLTAAVSSNATNTILAGNNNIHHNKEWQFIQTVLNESSSYLNDFNQQQINSKCQNNFLTTSPLQLSTSLHDYNLEKIINLQNELTMEQKEIKSNEVKTMEQIKKLNQNVTKLTKKFEEFTKNINTKHSNIHLVKNVKNSLEKIHSSIQNYHLKIENDCNFVNQHSTILSETPIESANESSSNLKETSSSPSLIAMTPIKFDNSEQNLNEINQEFENTQLMTSSPPITKNNGTKRSQIMVNRFLRDSIKQKLGEEFLINKKISEIPKELLESIKKEAFETFFPEKPIKSWCLAIASLRVLKRDLMRIHKKI